MCCFVVRVVIWVFIFYLFSRVCACVRVAAFTQHTHGGRGRACGVGSLLQSKSGIMTRAPSSEPSHRLSAALSVTVSVAQTGRELLCFVIFPPQPPLSWEHRRVPHAWDTLFYFGWNCWSPETHGLDRRTMSSSLAKFLGPRLPQQSGLELWILHVGSSPDTPASNSVLWSPQAPTHVCTHTYTHHTRTCMHMNPQIHAHTHN